MAKTSTIVERDTLVASSPTKLQRSVRAAEVARRWLEAPGLGGIVGLFGVTLEEIRSKDSDGQAESEWLHLREELPTWADAVLTGRSSVPAELDPTVELLRSTLRLEQWAATSFNFRSAGAARGTYRERNEAASGNFTALEADEIRRLADQIGLRQSTKPHYKAYQSTLVLGGGWKTPLLRARYAALWAREHVDLGNLYFLGSPRFLLPANPVANPPTASEESETHGYAPGAIDEFDLMVAAGASEFEFKAGPSLLLCGCSTMREICPKWRFATSPPADTPPRYTHEKSVDLADPAGRVGGVVLSASTGRPPYRPDTTDTLALWSRQAVPEPGARILVVTTQVFVPFQAFDSLKRLYLRYGVDIDVIGYSPEWGDRPDNPEYLLQETLSAIRSARRLLIDALAPFVA